MKNELSQAFRTLSRYEGRAAVQGARSPHGPHSP